MQARSKAVNDANIYYADPERRICILHAVHWRSGTLAQCSRS